MQQSTAPDRGNLPVILSAAVVQGWALFGLHHSIKVHAWPSTDLGWLLGLYAAVVLVPVTIQLLADHVCKPTTWAIVGAMAVAFLYFGWHHGRLVAGALDQRFAESGECFPLAIVLVVLWLLLMPFVQARTECGRWTAEYRRLFGYAWRNAITLAEAAAFTALFWLLLFLWQSLFHMLQINFFRDLFEEPIFIYPVTSLAFGCALHLIGSVERLVSTVLDQILNVFKWLGTVTGLLLALFSLALLARLPSLVVTGQKAIGANWLLWLVAVVVLFLNAAFRDGTVAKPYPRGITASLRVVIPLTLVVALTAGYALYVRAMEYGLTVGRVWGFVVAGAALKYSAGYAIAAARKGAWFGAIAQVNVVVAIALIATISLALTPVLSPYRLSANSQYAMVLQGRFNSTERLVDQGSPFRYLRFDSGEYGRRKLAELAQVQGRPGAERIRRLASAASKLTNSWQYAAAEPVPDVLARTAIYPSGRSLDADLAQRVVAALTDPRYQFKWSQLPDSGATGLFVDLSPGGGGTEQFVLLWGGDGIVFRKGAGGWAQAGQAYWSDSVMSQQDIRAKLAQGEVSTRDAKWKELWIGTHRVRIE